MTPEDRRDARIPHVAGLCGTCSYRRSVTSAKGSVFVRCGLSETDERFPKFPRLPVLACSGFREDGKGERRHGSAGKPIP